MNLINKILRLLIIAFIGCTTTNAQNTINSFKNLKESGALYEKTEWDISLTAPFTNPYNSKEITLDMVLTSPSGKTVAMPCFYVQGNEQQSDWKARFTPQETGVYTFVFKCNAKGISTQSQTGTFFVKESGNPGFLRKNNLWTFRFDNGTLFRGIGENVGWEFRKWEDPKYTYDYLLPTLSKNGANFFRTWMCSWNLPLEWKTISSTDRYKNTDQYFNPDAIKRMDELMDMIDSLDLYVMLTLDWHGELISDAEWKHSSYNKANGGQAENPTEFFTLEKAQNQYKNKLRYIIARWGYSTHIAAWEFFNEIDNAAFNGSDSILIPHAAVAQWHDEMGMYIKNTDPYNHLVTTSISHRDIMGMNSSAYMDFNQKHIYKHTDRLASTIKTYAQNFNKPYVIGEFGYEWDWNIDFKTIAKESDHDYKIGLWYGLFSPTPILPMTWWWEFFDERGMTSYFQHVRKINDQMLQAGNGSFEEVTSQSGNLESYAVKCGETVFVYVLNNTLSPLKNDINLNLSNAQVVKTQMFFPSISADKQSSIIQNVNNTLVVQGVSLKAKEDVILILELKDT